MLSDDTTRLDDHAWTTLQATLPRLMAAYAPGWTDKTENDPGITLLQLTTFLIDELYRRNAIPSRAVTDVARIEHVLARLPWRSAAGGSTVVRESWSGAKRPRYFEGRLLTAADLHDEQEYQIRKRREFQAVLHGAGVVAGLRVGHTDAGATITIGPGLAIDAEGREIRLSEDLSLPVPAGTPSPVYIVLEYAERETDLVPSPTAGEPEATRIEEGCRVLLGPAPQGGVVLARLIRTEEGWCASPPDREL